MKLSFVILLTYSIGIAQVSRVDYQRVMSWAKVSQSLPYLSKEEKDRIAITRRNDRIVPIPYILEFDYHQSIYQIDNDNLPLQEFNWRREKMIIHTDYKSKRRLDNIEMLGKKFIFDEDLPKIKWKILNEIKEVAGYVCMKAETYDSIKSQTITAWFASEIPVPIGPENFYGLPGLILEIQKNGDCSVITATKIALSTSSGNVSVPKKKGKKTTTEKFNKLIAQHIRESIEAQRNPFWSIYY